MDFGNILNCTIFRLHDYSRGRVNSTKCLYCCIHGTVCLVQTWCQHAHENEHENTGGFFWWKIGMRLERAPIEIIQALPLLFHIHNTTRKLILKYIRLLDHRALFCFTWSKGKSMLLLHGTFIVGLWYSNC